MNMNNVSNEVVIYISVLNWNKATTTLACLESLLKLEIPINFKVKIFVVDNGSAQDDWIRLSEGINNNLVTVIRLEQNLGFTGGHNMIMQQAIDDNADYVWLVNNDGKALPETLVRIVDLAESDPSCGAVSPMLFIQDEQIIEFCGAYYEWDKLAGVHLDYKIDYANKFDEKSFWLIGAAILLRVKALREVGLLDDKFFAYSEDNDICAKLAFSGWKNRIAYNALFQHDRPSERPPYFYYLMARNAFFFWLRHTPKEYRRFISLRLLERSIFSANRLLFCSESKNKADACLLGGLDGFLDRGGRPNLDRSVPWLMVFLRKILWPYHRNHLKNSFH